MSCTENESGPFVVFFLPAVVGCLTILLARRWTTSQPSSGTTTAISRRRKIIKDPLVKRPLPPIACKMMPQATRKTNGVLKKGNLANTEDELANGMKRLNRQVKSPAASTNGTAKPELLMAPKHIPFPHIPYDGELLYESMSFMFLVVATLLQFLNLYKTMWWLPNSTNTETMHYYLIDTHLVSLILTILGRRLLLTVLTTAVRPFVSPKQWPQVAVACRMFALGIVVGALGWCTYFIALKYPLVKLIYLCYPTLMYFLLFGFQSAPFLELENPPVYHNCSTDPHAIRAEVDVLRRDFNLRLNKILFNSLIGAYYSSFIPLCFAQGAVWTSSLGCLQQSALVWGALAARGAGRLLPPPALDVLHRAALHLATFELTSPSTHRQDGSESREWRADRLWAGGARVSLGGRLYRCLAPASAAATPGNAHHARFYTMFKNPSSIICAMLCLQGGLIFVQLTLLFTSTPWNNFLSLFLLLFMNYYTVFKLVRDYLISWKVYKAEGIVLEKSYQNIVN